MAKTPSRLKTYLRRSLVYGSGFSVAFFLTVYWSFPYDTLAERYIGQAEQRLGMEIEIGELSPYWFVGMRARDVTLTKPGESEEAGPMVIPLQSLTARLKPIDSLLGGLSAAFDLQSEMGAVSGSVQQEEQNLTVNADLEKLDLAKVPSLADSLGVGLLGLADGNVTLTLPAGQMAKASGVADLSFAEAGIGGGMVKGFTVPPVALGDFKARFVAEDGKLSLDPELEIHSKDLDATISGGLQMRPIFGTSRADLELRFRPTDAFWTANEKLAGLAKALLRNAEGKNGFYGYRVSGAIGRPQITPKR